MHEKKIGIIDFILSAGPGLSDDEVCHFHRTLVHDDVRITGQPDAAVKISGSDDGSAPQQVKVSGTITDATTKEPLVGVNVVLEGTTIGVMTDINGRYSLTVPNLKGVLQISYIGYVTRKIPVNGMTVIDIVLTSDAQALSEVVVVGYGTQKKSDLTGSISSVKAKDLVQLPVMRADQQLQGRAAGVVVTNTDGAPGGNTTVRIRGSNSITGGNNALVVIDGFQGGNLSSINPNEIESVEVLKDASATAIYGSRGANGVILVTTKKGKTGAPVVDYTYTFGLQNIAHKIDLMNAGDYAKYQMTIRLPRTAMEPRLFHLPRNRLMNCIKQAELIGRMRFIVQPRCKCTSFHSRAELNM